MRYIVYKDGDTWYAAGLDFNIVEASDDPRNALVNLFDALEGYVEAARKIRGGRVGHLLNQKADPQYETLWRSLQSSRKVRSPYQVHTFGVTKV